MVDKLIPQGQCFFKGFIFFLPKFKGLKGIEKIPDWAQYTCIQWSLRSMCYTLIITHVSSAHSTSYFALHAWTDFNMPPKNIILIWKWKFYHYFMLWWFGFYFMSCYNSDDYIITVWESSTVSGMFQVGSCPRVTLIASFTDQTLQCHSANNVSIPRDDYGSCFNGESWNDFYFESKQPEIVYIAPLKSETGVFDRWWCMQDPLWELFMTCSVQWIPCVVQWIISTVEQLDTVTQDDGAHQVTQCWSPLCSSPSQHSLTQCDSAAGGDGVSPTADAA